jgi:hypothetical protein
LIAQQQINAWRGQAGAVLAHLANDTTPPNALWQLAEAVLRLTGELEALRLVHQEARELIAEADGADVIPYANIEALRALLYRASIRTGAS